MISSPRTISSSRELDPLPITWDVRTQETLMAHLVADPTKYIEKILETCESTLGSKPKKARPPLEDSDQPELDTSEQ